MPGVHQIRNKIECYPIASQQLRYTFISPGTGRICGRCNGNFRQGYCNKHARGSHFESYCDFNQHLMLNIDIVMMC